MAADAVYGVPYGNLFDDRIEIRHHVPQFRFPILLSPQIDKIISQPDENEHKYSLVNRYRHPAGVPLPWRYDRLQRP